MYVWCLYACIVCVCMYGVCGVCVCMYCVYVCMVCVCMCVYECTVCVCVCTVRQRARSFSNDNALNSELHKSEHSETFAIAIPNGTR